MLAGLTGSLVAACAKKEAPLQLWSNPYAQREALLVAAAEQQVGVTNGYNPEYRVIGYPNGDIEPWKGVCTDVVVRAYRSGLGWDLQQLVHEDMKRAFYAYPNVQKWELTEPDPNIDHRRVLNLMVFLDRQGSRLPYPTSPAAFRPGDLVTQKLTATNNHIAIISDQWSDDGKRPLIIHNLCCGVRVEDKLYEFEITGHYRYLPPPQNPWTIDPKVVAAVERKLQAQALAQRAAQS